jgi:hypothetical protein
VPVHSAPSLRFNPMPPRTTQQSCRPRVSDRIMVGTLANAIVCLHSFQSRTRRAASRHETFGSERSTGLVSSPNESRTTPLQVSRGAGCIGQHPCSPRGEAEAFFLDILSYRTTYKIWSLPVSPRYPPIGTDCNLLYGRSGRICRQFLRVGAEHQSNNLTVCAAFCFRHGPSVDVHRRLD